MILERVVPESKQTEVLLAYGVSLQTRRLGWLGPERRP